MMDPALEPDQPSDPIRVLWLAVINQAIDDYESHINGKCGSCDQYEVMACQGAFHWIENAEDWFCSICSMVDIDPESVQVAARQRANAYPRAIRTR